MKKKAILMGLALALAATAAIGTTLAGYNTETDRAGVADISVRNLSIQILDESVPTSDSAQIDFRVPGDMVELERQVINNEANGYELYTRVTINKSWAKRSDLDSNMIHLLLDVSETGEPDYIELAQENADALLARGWILWYQDDEQVILFYQDPLAVGESTGAVLSAVLIDEEIDNEYADQNIEIAFRTDAVQKVAVNAAMPSEWGVYPVFEEGSDKLLAVEE